MMMITSLTQTVAPTREPVTLEEAREHLNIRHSEDDAQIRRMIKSARLQVESFTDRQLVTATYEYRLRSFPSEIIVPRPPLQSVSKIEYVDESEVTQTLSSSVYSVDTYATRGRIREAINQSWPTTADVYNAVVVTFVAGYGDPSDVPDDLIDALLILLGHLYCPDAETSRPFLRPSFSAAKAAAQDLMRQYALSAF